MIIFQHTMKTICCLCFLGVKVILFDLGYTRKFIFQAFKYVDYEVSVFDLYVETKLFE